MTKTPHLLFIICLCILLQIHLTGCTGTNPQPDVPQGIDTTVYTTDTSMVKHPLSVSTVELSDSTNALLNAYASVVKRDGVGPNGLVVGNDAAASLEGPAGPGDALPPWIVACLRSGPTQLNQLTDGVRIDAYDFKKGDEVKLEAMGFLNVSFSKDERITVIEFRQHGTSLCESRRLPYGIGARLMLRVTQKKKGAKLATPQQISASVTFGKAEVRFSLLTFGIVGPGVAQLNNTGAMNEDTYSNFLKAVSSMITEMYTSPSNYIVTPQPLFLPTTAEAA